LVDCQTDLALLPGVQTLPTDEVDRRHLGRLLRRYRESAALTQEGLSARAHVTKNYVSALEAGTRNPSYLVLRRILGVLGVAWTDFGREIDASR
jgi:transcriptional regulator with XRE-family HTH domain